VNTTLENTTLENTTASVDLSLWLKKDGIAIRHWTITQSTSGVNWRSTYISRLNTNDDGRIYQCEAIIDAAPLVKVTSSFLIDVTGWYHVLAKFIATYCM